MGVPEAVKTNLGHGFARLGIEWRAIVSAVLPSQAVIDRTRLVTYYGQEAAEAFARAITPQVHSVLKLQLIRQARWDGRPNPFPEPDIDPRTGLYAYRFVTVL